jgi:hypothetical protein
MVNDRAAEQARAADRPCRCAQDRTFFEDCFPDLLNQYAQGRRLTRKPLGRPWAILSRVAHLSATSSRHAYSPAEHLRACSSHRDAIAPCPARVWNVVAFAHRTEMPSRPAKSCAKRTRPCSPHRNLVAPCPLACETPSPMPSPRQRHRARPTRVRNVVAHAHLSALPSRHAHSRTEGDLDRCGRPNRRV